MLTTLFLNWHGPNLKLAPVTPILLVNTMQSITANQKFNRIGWVNMMSTTVSPTRDRIAENIAACNCNRKSKCIFVLYLWHIRLTVMFLIFIFYKSREMS